MELRGIYSSVCNHQQGSTAMKFAMKLLAALLVVGVLAGCAGMNKSYDDPYQSGEKR